MHVLFVHFFPYDRIDTPVYINLSNDELEFSIIERSNIISKKGNLHYIKDEFDLKLKWWQNSEVLNNCISKFNPDLVYIFGLNLPLHFRWLKHHISSKTILIGQHCGENIWIQRNLWLQQSALRVVDGFVFESMNVAMPWLKCAAILESQPIFEMENFKNNIVEIYKKLLNDKSGYK